MAKNEFMLSKDEKEIRRYNVFQGKKSKAKSKGVDLIVTNKRLITKTYDNGFFNKRMDVKEIPLENVAGDVNTSIVKKVGLLRVIILILAALFFFSLSGDFEDTLQMIFILLGLAMIVLVVLAFVFPKTEGTLEIYGKGYIYQAVKSSGGSIINKRKIGGGLLDICAGRDFDLIQMELGSVINELKNGNEPEQLKTKRPARHDDYEETPRTPRPTNRTVLDADDDDDDIPLI